MANSLPKDMNYKGSLTHNSQVQHTNTRKKRIKPQETHKNKHQETEKEYRIKMEDSFVKDIQKQTGLLINKNSINKPKFQDQIDTVEEINASLILSPIQKYKHTNDDDQTLEQLDSFSQNESILTNNFNTASVVPPLYRPTISNSRTPKHIEIVQFDSEKSESNKIKEKTFISSSSRLKNK